MLLHATNQAPFTSRMGGVHRDTVRLRDVCFNAAALRFRGLMFPSNSWHSCASREQFIVRVDTTSSELALLLLVMLSQPDQKPVDIFGCGGSRRLSLTSDMFARRHLAKSALIIGPHPSLSVSSSSNTADSLIGGSRVETVAKTGCHGQYISRFFPWMKRAVS